MDSSGPTPESAIRSPTAGGYSSASPQFSGWSRPILRGDPSSPSGLNRAAVNGADARWQELALFELGDLKAGVSVQRESERFGKLHV